jgi:hypothetical protein
LESYCDSTGGRGIGFEPSHTYDYRFRQRLKTRQAPELRRLFVLHHLHLDFEFQLKDFEKGAVRPGKSSYRPLALAEGESTPDSMGNQIDDLASYTTLINFSTTSVDLLAPCDPALEVIWIEHLGGRLRKATNAPVTHPGIQSAAAEWLCS